MTKEEAIKAWERVIEWMEKRKEYGRSEHWFLDAGLDVDMEMVLALKQFFPKQAKKSQSMMPIPTPYLKHFGQRIPLGTAINCINHWL